MESTLDHHLPNHISQVFVVQVVASTADFLRWSPSGLFIVVMYYVETDYIVTCP